MEDSHYFLKSINLESYIDHEKNFCESLTREEMDNLDYSSLGYSKMKIEETGEKAQEMDIPGKTDGINEEVSQIMGSVHADDFFSSLELQSSSKMSSSVINFPSFPKMTCGIVTRSRSHVATSHDVSQKIIDKPGRKEKVKRQGKTVRNRVRKKVSKCKRDPDKGKKSKVRGRNSQVGKRSSLDVKSAGGSDGRKYSQSSVKTEDGVTVRGVSGDKNKEDDWVFFQHLGMRRDVSMEDKLLGHELNATGRRSTPELFSISPILMTDDMSEEKDKVDKLLSVDDYDETFLEEMEEFGNAPPRSHTGGKWKPGSLPVRSSPILWQSQNWESFLDDRNTNYEASGKITSETSVEPPVESHEGKGQSLVSTGGKWKSFAPPASHTGGKWKPMTPPATYTGGKWKPSEVPQRTKVVDNTEPSWKSQSSSSSSGPPISHTGGKWKPNSADHCREDLTSGKVKSNVPSPSHTHGKWVSGPVKGPSGRTPLDIVANSQRTSGKCLKTSGGMIQYYCSPCNRRLSSKKMYRNHVQSELHLKRVLQENDLEFDSRSLKMFRGLFTQTVRKERGLGKRLVKPPEMYKATEVETSKKEKKSVELKGKKRPRKEMVRCEVCKIKVPSYQLGKHLVSYYHIRRMQLNDPVQRNLILSNIHAIVKQAPYQCGLCKFYCNTHVLFKKHWALSVHKEAEQQQGHRFWCALCNFECETTKSMELHLDSNSHREVIQAVNKSIPIIIRHKFVFSCSICFKEFRFSRELTRHREVHHPETLDADAGNKFACTLCDQSCKSMKSLQKHIIHMHKGDVKIPYFCSTCNEFFATVTEAKNHRNGQLHKYKKALADSGGLPQKKGLVRTCTYCGETLENIDKLKSHLYDRHRSLLPKCIKCGMTFALSQEVSRHVKNRECDFSIKRSEGPASGAFKCDVCTFSTDSQSEFLLHTAIHQKGSEETKKIACPLCGTSYTQAALSVHLRTHLKEKTYQCSMCSSTFVRKDRYVAHLKSKHLLKDGEVSGSKGAGTEQATQESQRSTPKENEGEESGELGQTTRENQSGKSATEKRKICGDAKCKYVAKDEKDLETHSLVHVGPKVYKCPECPYCAKTNAVMKRHYMIHIDEKQFQCPHCPFKGRLKSHLKRHLRLHTGAKPYKCPHCSYTCNILENLRKHVLNTKIHPGKKLYECKLCRFETNVSKDFKTHLSENHKENCRGSEEAVIVAGIYNREADLTSTATPLPGKRKVSAASAPKPPSEDLKRKIDCIAQKYSPIMPKTSLLEKRENDQSSKSKRNLVEDKRKVLEMELEKLKKQIKPERRAARSYPSPAEKFLQKATKAEDKIGPNKAKEEDEEVEATDESDVLLVNLGPTDTGGELTVQQVKLPPAYVLCDGGSLTLKDSEFYLLEDYDV